MATARRPATVRDVAAAAGVSPKTVSNVVNDHPHVHPATRARVQEHIDALGYRPSAVGRQLRTGRTGVIALAVPDVQAPYFAALSALLVAAARERDLTVVVEQTDGLLEREREVIAGSPVRFADGLVFSPLEMDDAELAAPHPDTPVVLVGEHGAAVPLDRVGIDSVAVAVLATEHLLSLGRRRVAFVGAKAVLHQTARQRLAGYTRALAGAGLAADADLVPDTPDWDRAGGEAAATALLAARPDVDAVVAGNDVLAVGVLRALRRHGRRVPEDVAVAGVDDVDECRYTHPTLTTVAVDRAYVAEHALELLVTRLEDPSLPPRRLEAPFALRVRESTAGPAASA